MFLYVVSYEVLAHHPPKDAKGKPKALVFDNNGHLWVGFKGNGEVIKARSTDFNMSYISDICILSFVSNSL